MLTARLVTKAIVEPVEVWNNKEINKEKVVVMVNIVFIR